MNRGMAMPRHVVVLTDPSADFFLEKIAKIGLSTPFELALSPGFTSESLLLSTSYQNTINTFCSSHQDTHLTREAEVLIQTQTVHNER